ncbi:MAG: hypothetical protein ACPGIA_11030 [Luteolibacter sp.]
MMEPREQLMGLLQKRESVIADHDWRERNAATHLDALKEVSIAIDNWSVQHSDCLDPKLSHYLNNASFAKALDHLQQSNSAN